MSGNSTNSTSGANSTDSGNQTIVLPPSLDLPAHLSAQKYFFVCTLTVAAWDVLVLTPRTWRLMKTRGWPILKIIYYFLRLYVPAEFTIVGVAFFDTAWTMDRCYKFYLFEPICTAILLAITSFVHCYRIWAIYEKSRSVLHGMGSLYVIQIVVTAICCGFYRATPLLEGQGCIAEPKARWVGIYWLSATMLYSASLFMAVRRAYRSWKLKHVNLWKLMLRDGLNLYLAVWLVNAVNMFFWFIIKPTGDDDPIRTIVTSMAAVLTASMTMRIILSVRGPLAGGGRYAGTKVTRSTGTARSRGAGVTTNPVLSIQQPGQPATYTVPLGGTESKTGEWQAEDGKSSVTGEREKADIYAISAAQDVDADDVDIIEAPKGPELEGMHIQIKTETHLEMHDDNSQSEKE
ncbi:hypothetical protein WOLCODRAFT_136688 [Wolfiporia cocos MD-104 SS10]|uniref:Uncharacterized protein n=1 Tax=Wolfiporia cocos (strain MD-104) TaxID=742152 RepID=A0A2H3JD27_WOLCO|nr:hypothetical protein WOLCODRAFT_136688 [Wolfiporia cocos MD-104 SS10]